MKKKAAAIIIIIFILSGIFIISLHDNKADAPEEKQILNEYELESYLNLKGWKVEMDKMEQVKIPQSFTGMYKIFSDEMKNAGFDLDSHKGEEVRRYIYTVTNYGVDGVKAELLLTMDNELISAVLIEQKPDGFIKPI